MKSSKTGKISLSLIELVIGVLLLINPIRFTTAIIIALGVLLLLFGIYRIIKYFKASPIAAVRDQNLTKGLLTALVGSFCIFKSNWFIATFPVLTVLYGAVILIIGIAKIQWTVDMLRLKITKWFWGAISSAITLICAAVILCNPFNSTLVLWTFIAINLIVESVFDMLAAFLAKDDDITE